METAQCPTTDEWVKKMWHMCSVVYYSTIKKDEIMSLAGK
jgi:hypothetical protein